MVDDSFAAGKKQAEEILAKDETPAELRKDFRDLTQSINKADVDKAKKHAMIAGIFAAVDELMKEGNETKTANICLDVLGEYEGSKADVEASEDILHREMERVQHAVDEKIPQADVTVEPELVDVTFSEG